MKDEGGRSRINFQLRMNRFLPARTIYSPASASGGTRCIPDGFMLSISIITESIDKSAQTHIMKA